MSLSLLIVEDETTLRESLVSHFHARGLRALEAPDVETAKILFSRERLDLALIDIHLPDGTGIDLAGEFHALDRDLAIVMITAHPDVHSAVEATRAGARDYLIKPFDLRELNLVIDRVCEEQRLKRDLQIFSRNRGGDSKKIVAESAGMKRALKMADDVSASPNTHVLIRGETGVGKEIVAQAVHSSGPLVKINCSAIPEQLMDSELFGHERGAFTDARETRVGLFELADGGTLFLDEISEMGLSVQPKLLRAVEKQPFRRVGGRKDITVDVRIIAATHRNMEEEIKKGRFREDLYYRLKVFQIDVPPLRDRKEDIIPLARHYAETYGRGLYGGPLALSPTAEYSLAIHRWPGNVRELRNILERAAILCGGDRIDTNHLPTELRLAGKLKAYLSSTGEDKTLRRIEQLHIRATLDGCGWNKSEAARRLGINRKTLREKLEQDSV